MLLPSGDWIDAEDFGCFKFLDSAVDLVWVEAQQECQSIGGYLAEPSTARYDILLSVDLFWLEAQQECQSIGGYLVEPSTASYRV